MPVPFWAKPRFVLLAILLYLATHLAIRMAMGHALSVDDSEQALLSQGYAWAYRFKAPPLFNWLMVTLAHVLPAGVFSIALLRYTLLGVLYGFVYLTARRLLADPRLSALAVYSFATLNPFAEATHRNLTHSTAMLAVTALAWYVFVRLAAAPQLGWYLALGIVFGLGIIAKWNFVILVLSLPLACLVSRNTRHLVLTWKIVPAALLTAAVVLPTFLATLKIKPPESDQVSTVLRNGGGHSLTQIAQGTWKLLDTAIIYSLPFLPIALILFALPLWRGLRAGARRHDESPSRPDAALVGTTMAIGLACVWAIVLFAGATELKVRYLFPILLVLPVWFFMLVETGRPSKWSINLFALVAAALAVFVAGKRVAVIAGIESCGICTEWRPFGAIAEQLEAAGYEGGGTILADAETGGNLLPYFPKARIIDPMYPSNVWPAASGEGQCLLLSWDGGNESLRAALFDHLGSYLSANLGGNPASEHRDGVLAAPKLAPAEGTLQMSYRLYDVPNGKCR